MAGAAAGDFGFQFAIMMKDLFGSEENEMMVYGPILSQNSSS